MMMMMLRVDGVMMRVMTMVIHEYGDGGGDDARICKASFAARRLTSDKRHEPMMETALWDMLVV